MKNFVMLLFTAFLSFAAMADGLDPAQFPPPPLLAVARTPYSIPVPKNFNIQSDLGHCAGLAGFIDASSGNVGFPVAGRTAICISYDKDGILIEVQMGYPYGRNLRKTCLDKNGRLEDDDVFEVLLEPRSGGKGGRIYRFIGNAAGVLSTDVDIPAVGQFHQNWGEGVSYNTMMWDPSRSFMGAITIPFSILGGAPGDGEIWGIQCAFKYADPKITGLLSPAKEMTDTSRFARIRFDHKRSLNFNQSPLDSMKGWDLMLEGIFNNSSEKEANATLEVELLKGDKRVDRMEKTFKITPLNKYSPITRLIMKTNPSKESEKDTVAVIRCFDRDCGVLIYEHSIRYWKEDVPSEQKIKKMMSKEFTFNIGPYPSAGSFEYLVDTKTLQEMNKEAASLNLSLRRSGKELTKEVRPLDSSGILTGLIRESKERRPLPEGVYELDAKIMAKDGSVIAGRVEKFDRKIFPFENYVLEESPENPPEPFTKPEVKGMGISCVMREYVHGKDALLEQIVANGEGLFSSPVQFFADDGSGRLVALTAGNPVVKAGAHATAQSSQTFTGPGLKLEVKGSFDYDGFYKFSCDMSPTAGQCKISRLFLRIPMRNDRAIMMDLPVDFTGWDLSGMKSCGLIDSKASGRIADSLMYRYDKKKRAGNMPPYLWIGDDARGLCLSMASEKGCFNDEKLPALTVDRDGAATIIDVSFVNRPVTLSSPSRFEFALQASPFKPQPKNARLWRSVNKDSLRYASYKKDGLFMCNYQNTGGTYPTYGRFLDLGKMRAGAEDMRKKYSTVQVPASACSECAGTPEYKTFWHEWGSPMGFDKMNIPNVPEPVRKMFAESDVPCDGLVMVEAISNTCESNLRYRLWWFAQTVEKAGIDYIYQDNSPYQYYCSPEAGLGYIRDDGRQEPESAIWQNREFMKKAKEISARAGKGRPNGVWPNIVGAPIRSFCDTGIIGECPESDKLRLDFFRLWFSKQWGMQETWLFQTPLFSNSAPRRYWRTLCSRLLLHDVTDFSRSEDVYGAWLIALDVLRLDDPTLAWHPYYDNDTVKTTYPSTLVSSYTVNGKALLVVSNQNPKEDVIEELAPMPSLGQLKHFYDAETGEDITVKNGKLKIFVPLNDYRLVIGFDKPFRFAASRLFEGREIPPQSELDPRKTFAAICSQLMSSPKTSPIPGGHRFTEEWVSKIVGEAMSSPDSRFMDEKQCESIDISAPQIRKSMIVNPKGKYTVVTYLNPTDKHVMLNSSVRKVFGPGYIVSALNGVSDWGLVDLEPGQGRIELIYGNASDYWGERRGPMGIGTQMSNMLEASLEARKVREGK